MAAKNPDSATGEFRPRRAHTPPAHRGIHHPGSNVTETSHIPEFHAQTLPAHSNLPPSRTFPPNNPLHVAAQDAATSPTAVKDTGDVPGSTSADVNHTFNRRVFGTSSNEAHHDLQPGRKGQKTGLARFGKAEMQGAVDPRDPIHADQRALDKDDVGGKRSTKGQLSAGEIPPQRMETQEGRHPGKGKKEKVNKRQTKGNSVFTE